MAQARLARHVLTLAKQSLQNHDQIVELLAAAQTPVRQGTLRLLLLDPRADVVVGNLLIARPDLFGSHHRQITGIKLLSEARSAAGQAHDRTRVQHLDNLLNRVYRTRMDNLRTQLAAPPLFREAGVDLDISTLREDVRYYLDQAYSGHLLLSAYSGTTDALPGHLFLDLLRYDPDLYNQLQLIEFFLNRPGLFWLRNHLSLERFLQLPYLMVVEQREIVAGLNAGLTLLLGRNLANFVLRAT